MVQPLWKKFWQFYKVWGRVILWLRVTMWPSNALLGMYSREMRTFVYLKAAQFGPRISSWQVLTVSYCWNTAIIVSVALLAAGRSWNEWSGLRGSVNPGLQLVGDALQDTLLQDTASWHMDHFKLKEFDKKAEAGTSFWPPHFLDLLQWNSSKPLMLEVPSLSPQERSILLGQRQRAAKKSAVSPSSCNYLTPLTPSYSSIPVRSSSNPA